MRTYLLALVPLAFPRLAGAQGAPLAKEFQRPPTALKTTLHEGHGDPVAYASCKVTIEWTKRQLDGTVVTFGTEKDRELELGSLYGIGAWSIRLTGMKVGEMQREWTDANIFDVTLKHATCPSLPDGLRIVPGAVVRGNVRGAIDVSAPPDGGSVVVKAVKATGSSVVVDYMMSESLAEWTERYPMNHIEARLAHAQAGLDRKAGRLNESMQALRHALQLEPELFAAATDLAELLLNAGKRDDAFAAIALVEHKRPIWLYREILERPALAELTHSPGMKAALAAPGNARLGNSQTRTAGRVDGFTVAYSKSLDAFALVQSTDFDGNGGGSWIELIGADGATQTSLAPWTCDESGINCKVDPRERDLLNHMLTALGFDRGEEGELVSEPVNDRVTCRYRFPSVHVGVVCDRDQVRVLQKDDVLIEDARRGQRYTFAARFPGIVVLGTWSDGYGHQTITSMHVFRSARIP